MLNPAAPKTITAHTAFRGVSHHARGDVREDPIQEREAFKVSATGRDKKIVSTLGYRVSVPIVGTLASLAPLLQTFADSKFGRPVAPAMMRVSALNTGTDVLTIGTHGLTTADPVMIAYDEVAPTLNSGTLSQSTIYFARAVSGTTISLHATANDATNNAAVINFTADATSGSWWVCAQRALTVHRNTGVIRTYRNAIVEKFPTLVSAGGKLTWTGDLVFRCLPGWDQTPDGSDAAAFWTEAISAYTPPAWSAADVLTAPSLADAAWGATPPWDAIRSEGGWQIEFAPQLSDLDNGIWPSSALIMDGFAITAKGKAIGLTKPQIDAINAKDLGALVTGDDLELNFAGYTLTLLEAILEPVGTIFSPTNRIVPEMTWMAHGASGTDLQPAFTLVAA
jgi:hypothetical protein